MFRRCPQHEKGWQRVGVEASVAAQVESEQVGVVILLARVEEGDQPACGGEGRFEQAGEPFVLAPRASCAAEYEVPANAWYFEANRCERMSFAVLLEVALQPCGWLAAYAGSALLSEADLHFRNLDGTATQLAEVGRDAGTLTMRARMTTGASAA